jgi:drug/metabolite transporter (DMT)-like permease
MHQAGEGSVAWLVAGSRGASVVAILVALVILRPHPPAGGRRWIGIALLAGVFDVLGNGLFVAAVQTGALAIAAVTSSLYPITTVILARVILGERFAHVHVIGIVAATAAVVCIAAG